MTESAEQPPPPPASTAPLADVKVPVVQVLASNIEEVWPSLVHSIKYSSFIAIDLVGVQHVQYVLYNMYSTYNMYWNLLFKGYSVAIHRYTS